MDPFAILVCLVALEAICVALTLFAGLRPLWRVGSVPSGAGEDASDMPAPESVPSLTVVVYVYTYFEELHEYLEKLLQQDYPDFSVVVVTESTPEASASLAEQFAGLDPRLYFTYIAPGSHNLSRQKLALTLGIKAAKGEYVLTTRSNCEIPGIHWLSDMMRPVADAAHTEVALGYSAPDFSEIPAPGRWYRQFDFVMTSAQWLGAALAGYPYRGDGNNLLFRRDLFFEHKGYSSTMFLHGGEDDLFVNEIADRANTAVVLSSGSILTQKWGESASRVLTSIKEKYRFDARYLPAGPFMQAGFASAMQWIVPALCAAVVIMSLPLWWMSAIAGGLLLIMWVAETVLYCRAARRLGQNSAPAVVAFMLWRPVGNFFFSLRHRSARIKNFTWQRRKRRRKPFRRR